MKATRLRLFLIIGFALLFAGLCAGGWWLQTLLAKQVSKADHARIDSELSQLDLEKLRLLETKLVTQKDIVERADQIAATASNYQYQDQVVSDLEVYAKRHGIKISGFDFGATASPGAASAPAGTTRTPFSVALKGPIGFDIFMNFLRDIENNLTKLQVNSLSLTPTQDNPNMVNNPSLSLVVYLKK